MPKRTSRTSLNIKSKIARLRTITAHISPYSGGLAPETRIFVDALNDESARRRTGIKYTATANKIKASGSIETAAKQSTLGGWFLRGAIRAGYLDGEETVLKRGNSEHRKKLRKRAKTKDGTREKAERDKAMRNRKTVRRIAETGDAFIGSSAVVPGSWPKAWIDGVYMPILHPEKPRDDTNG
jgi:hypothetical protein